MSDTRQSPRRPLGVVAGGFATFAVCLILALILPLAIPGLAGAQVGFAVLVVGALVGLAVVGGGLMWLAWRLVR